MMDPIIGALGGAPHMCDASLGAGRRAVWGAERGTTQTLGLGQVPHRPPLLGPLDAGHGAHRRRTATGEREVRPWMLSPTLVPIIAWTEVETFAVGWVLSVKC